MDAFLTTYPLKKFHAECSRENKISCKHIPQEKKKSVWIKGLKKKIHAHTKSPTPPKVKWLAPYVLLGEFNWIHYLWPDMLQHIERISRPFCLLHLIDKWFLFNFLFSCVPFFTFFLFRLSIICRRVSDNHSTRVSSIGCSTDWATRPERELALGMWVFIDKDKFGSAQA